MKVLYKILGVVFVIMALLFALINMYGWMVFCGIFAVICFVMKPKTKKEKAAEEEAARAASAAAAAAKNPYEVFYFDVAGVTFDNDDGKSRQKILRAICDGDKYGRADAELVAYTYEGEPAFRVMTDEGCVGNIRRKDIAEVQSLLDRKVHSIVVSAEQYEDDNDRKKYSADVEIKVMKKDPAQE